MINILQRFFDFCSSENREKFYRSIILGVLAALFNALKIPAIGLVLQNILNHTLSASVIWTCFGILLVSVIGEGLIKYKANMLQTEAGYNTACDKRMEIAQHMRYLPMGYFNANSLGKI